jgi:hypothetical protein
MSAMGRKLPFALMTFCHFCHECGSHAAIRDNPREPVEEHFQPCRQAIAWSRRIVVRWGSCVEICSQGPAVPYAYKLPAAAE